MRNLKKFLALVLAMMMTLSLMVTVNAAATSDFTDADSITKEFREGVAVLEGLGVFKGYTNGDKFDFRPGNPITRAEVATIVYRLATGDAGDKQAYLYEGGAKKFKDVPDDHWASGAIGYCANNLLVRGYDEVRFGPNDYVTGVQAITMILRAVGYGQGGEFEGWGWETRAYGRARAEGLLVNVDESNYQGKLTEVATRELVAELLFQASLIPQVTWTEALGYNKYTTLNGSTQNAYLAWENFKLAVGPWKVIDSWGRPGYEWSYKDGTAATIEGDYTVAYDSTTYECEVSEAMKIKTSQEFKLYVNGKTTVTDHYLVVATDTVTKVGGQGRITEVYGKLAHPWSDRVQGGFDAWDPSIVMIDTFLAKVTKVEKEVLDPAGHQMIKAKLHVEMYDGRATTESGGSDLVLEKSSGNWEFVKGDFITLNAYTDNANGWDANDVASSHSGTEANKNEAAFEAEQVKVKTGTNVVDTYANVAKCEPVLGKQTTIYWNQAKHNVDNVDKLDQLDLHLDVAGSTVNTTFAWYYDAKGNLIGIGDAPANSNYGIITSIYSAFKQGEGNTTGEAVAKAHVKYADGNEGDIIIDKFYLNSGAIAAPATAGHLDSFGDMVDAPAGTAVTNTAGVAELLPIYDNGTANAMAASVRLTAVPANTMAHGTQAGWLHVAPVSAVNANAEAAASTAATPWGRDDTIGSYGIIKGNLFKFVSSGDDAMTAIEVAGTTNNTGMYDNHYNELTNAQRELSKNYAYLTVNATTIRMDDDTKIVVRGWDATNTKATDTITVYNGIDELPANIVIENGTEVDWADIDNNGIADVVYVYGVKKGSTGYGLFYYNGGAGQWNGNDATGSGWLRGWLDAKEADLTFTDKELFDRVQQSTITYGGHLFAVKLLDGEVQDILGYDSITGSKNKDFILINAGTDDPFVPKTGGVMLSSLQLGAWDTPKTRNGLTSANSGNAFQFGTDNGNDYTATYTKAVWLHDDGLNQKDVINGALTTYTDVRYNADNNAIEVGTYTIDVDGTRAPTTGVGSYTTVYRLTGSSAKLGDDLYFLNMTGRVNDVTIVFEDNADDAIRQIYVTTRADITAPGGDGSYTSPVKPQAGPNLAVVPAGTTVNTPTTNAQLLNLIKSMRNTVIYSSNYATPDATLGTGVTDMGGGDVLWFPYGSPGSSKAVSLVIYNSNSVPVCTMNGSSDAVATKSNFFYMTTGCGGSQWHDTNAVADGALKAGVYTFVITLDDTGAVLSQGTFTMA